MTDSVRYGLTTRADALRLAIAKEAKGESRYLSAALANAYDCLLDDAANALPELEESLPNRIELGADAPKWSAPSHLASTIRLHQFVEVLYAKGRLQRLQARVHAMRIALKRAAVGDFDEVHGSVIGLHNQLLDDALGFAPELAGKLPERVSSQAPTREMLASSTDMEGLKARLNELEALLDTIGPTYDPWSHRDANATGSFQCRATMWSLRLGKRGQQESRPADEAERPAGLEVMKRAMEALNDPETDARIAAADERRERRQELVILGSKALQNLGVVRPAALKDLTELHHYLTMRKSKETDDGLCFEHNLGGPSTVATATWEAGGSEVRFSVAGNTVVARTDVDGRLSTRAIEDALARLGGAESEAPGSPARVQKQLERLHQHVRKLRQRGEVELAERLLDESLELFERGDQRQG